MYGGLRNSKLFGSGAHRRIALYDVYRQITGTLFDVRFQKHHSPLFIANLYAKGKFGSTLARLEYLQTGKMDVYYYRETKGGVI